MPEKRVGDLVVGDFTAFWTVIEDARTVGSAANVGVITPDGSIERLVFDSADTLIVVNEGASPTVVLTVPWAGKIAGAYADGDPNRLLQLIQRAGVNSLSPSALGTATARVSLFRLPFDLIVNRIRYYGVSATTNVFRVAIYRYSDGVRVTPELTLSTAAAAFGSTGGGLGIALTKGTQYYIAVATNDATSGTGALQTTGANVTATQGQIAVAPQNLPGNLDMDVGFTSGLFAQFTVVGGALPGTVPPSSLAAQALWTGNMPAFWLDNNDAP